MRSHVAVDGSLARIHLTVRFCVALAEGGAEPGVLLDFGHRYALVLVDVEDARQQVLAFRGQLQGTRFLVQIYPGKRHSILDRLLD